MGTRSPLRSRRLWWTVTSMEQSRGLLSRYGQLEFQQSREWSGSPGGRGYRGPSAGAGGAEGAASFAGAFVLQCGGEGVDGDVSSFAGAFVDVDAMVGIYSPSAVAFGVVCSFLTLGRPW